MTAYIRNIVIEAPDPEGLAAFYAELLDLETLRRPPDWMVIGREGEYPRLAFDPARDYRPPRWPDPAFPQQLHLDITVPDRAGKQAWLREHGATWLEDGSDSQVWADPAGHPFCLIEDTATARPRITGITLDSEDNAALASFYSALLDMRSVETGWDGWLALKSADQPEPVLAFAKVAEHRQPRWPDPEYPQQIHLDLQVDDQDAIVERALRLGARRLPAMGGDAPVLADPAGHPFCVCPMYTPVIKQMYADAWAVWLTEINAIDEAVTRTPGVCGDWTVHDVVGHVQAYARWRLAQVRGAFSGQAPTQVETDGARKPWPDGVADTTEARNAAIQAAGLTLTWPQLLDEAAWIRDETLAWLDQLPENLLDANVGQAPFWKPEFQADPQAIDGLMIRRVADVPAATDPLPVWRYVQPDEPDNHMSEHLEQIRTWLAGR
ncbi:MAG TPA: VOC family protein [Mycobacterium sp.]|nr:VOC family protein [Mycobacterium sp.]